MKKYSTLVTVVCIILIGSVAVIISNSTTHVSGQIELSNIKPQQKNEVENIQKIEVSQNQIVKLDCEAYSKAFLSLDIKPKIIRNVITANLNDDLKRLIELTPSDINDLNNALNVDVNNDVFSARFDFKFNEKFTYSPIKIDSNVIAALNNTSDKDIDSTIMSVLDSDKFTKYFKQENTTGSLLISFLKIAKSSIANQVIAAFIEKNYKVSEYDLIAATRMGLSDMKMRSLLNNYAGSLNFEFDAGLKSINLVLYAGLTNNIRLVNFWFENGVNPYANAKVGGPLDLMALFDNDANNQHWVGVENALAIGIRPMMESTYSSFLKYNKDNNYPLSNLEEYDIAPSFTNRELLENIIIKQAELLLVQHSINAKGIDYDCALAFFRNIEKIRNNTDTKESGLSENNNLKEGSNEAFNIYKSYLGGLITLETALESLNDLDTLVSKLSFDKLFFKIQMQNLQDKLAGDKRSVKTKNAIGAAKLESAENWESAELLLDEIDDLSSIDKNSAKLLVAINAMRPISEIKTILNQPVKVDIDHAITAIVRDHDLALNELFNAGLNPNSEDASGSLLIFFAVNYKAIDSFKVLIANNASLKHARGGMDALDMALSKYGEDQSFPWFTRELLRAGHKIEYSHIQLIRALYIGKSEEIGDLINEFDIEI
ncbi:hypothetical protein [Brumicola pallidula]|uniref:Ankyrin repeat-containing protein n=1 Tax=Brumicola pallidula DSM 14239 = ACAM 615 TaxID=1121922 RepID=K6ZYL8_9ALTE|nr:hypothetical protein [Glaciecola pallidula]GAC28390.1 hypothetical protein GPAL_1523 [Glaciecola pallidula DSM 14239 = ACAM 615]